MLTIIHLTIQLLYGIPLVFLYCFVIIVIIKSSENKQFQSAFFKLTVVIGIVDLLSYIDVWVWYKLTYCPDTAKSYEGHENFFLFPILGFFAYYLPLVRSYLLVISSANRFTALYPFNWHGKFWSKYWKHLVLLCLLISLITTITIPFGKVIYFPIGLYAPIKSSAIVILLVQDQWDPFWRPFTNACQVVAAICFTFAFNICALFCLIRSVKELNQRSTDAQKAKVGLLVISFWDLLIDLIYVLKQVSDFLGDKGKIDESLAFFLFDTQSWTMDLHNLSRPIFFLIFSKAIRKSFLNFIGFSRAFDNQVLFIRSATTPVQEIRRLFHPLNKQ